MTRDHAYYLEMTKGIAAGIVDDVTTRIIQPMPDPNTRYIEMVYLGRTDSCLAIWRGCQSNNEVSTSIYTQDADNLRLTHTSNKQDGAHMEYHRVDLTTNTLEEEVRKLLQSVTSLANKE